jgi:hypothetical protein
MVVERIRLYSPRRDHTGSCSPEKMRIDYEKDVQIVARLAAVPVEMGDGKRAVDEPRITREE